MGGVLKSNKVIKELKMYSESKLNFRRANKRVKVGTFLEGLKNK